MKLTEFLSTQQAVIEKVERESRMWPAPSGSLGSFGHAEHPSSSAHRSVMDTFRERALGNRRHGAYPLQTAQKKSAGDHQAADVLRSPLPANPIGGERSAQPADRWGAGDQDHVNTTWSTTSLASKTGGTRFIAPSPLAAQQRDISQGDVLLQLQRRVELLAAERNALQQQSICDEELRLRERHEADFDHQLQLWSQHLRLLIRFKIKKQATRPSQIFLESLREKDALEIRMLKAQVSQLSEEVVRLRQGAAMKAVQQSSVDSAPADEERREWNEVYRNLKNVVKEQAEALSLREVAICKLNEELTKQRVDAAITRRSFGGAASPTATNVGTPHSTVRRDIDSPNYDTRPHAQ